MFQDEVLPVEESERLHVACGKMADTVSESLQSYVWIVRHLYATYLASGKDTHLVPALLLMEYAEPIDGVSILARMGSARNCVVLIRSGFELQLNLMYMLERDDFYENRCLAYEFFHFQKQLKVAVKCDPDSETGKQVRGQIKGELLADAFEHPMRDIAREIKDAQALVNSPRYTGVKAEYERTKSKLKHRLKHWYELWDGPKDLEHLARELKRHGHYEVLYRYWSGDSHGESALRRIRDGKGGALEMRPVRSPQGLPMACLHACSFANEMTAFLVNRFLPSLREEMAARYLSRIKPGVEYIKAVRGLEG